MKVACILLLGVLLASCGDVRRVKPQSIEEFGDTLTYFYVHPSQELFAQIVNEAEWQEDTLAKSGNAELLPVFFAVCTKRYGYPLAAGGATSIAESRKVPDIDAYLLDDGLLSPKQNDELWIAFFASGDEKYLDRLFQRATVRLAPGVLIMSYSTAAWSYKANCRQHAAVLAHLGKQAVTERNRDYIAECRAWAAGGTPGPTQH